jgi:hypothetical protein
VTFNTLFLSVTLCLACPGAFARESDPLWTLSASGSWSDIDTADRDIASGSVSLSRQVGDLSIGGALASSSGSDALFEQGEITDRSSTLLSAWVVIPVAEASLDLSVTYGAEDFKGRLLVENGRFQVTDESEIDLASEVDSLSVAAALSRTFLIGNWDIIPNASLGWSQSEATSTSTSIGGQLDLGELSETQEGATASLGVGLGYLVSDQLYVFSDVVGLYAENGASSGVQPGGRSGGLRASGRQSTDEATWTELSIGASLYVTDTLTLSLSGGTTAGRDAEEVFATTTLSVSF